MTRAEEKPAERKASPWLVDAYALGAQCALFLVGLAVSLAIGMALATRCDGPGSLLFVTAVAGTLLLVAAGLSQVLHDWLIQRSLDQSA